MSFLLILYVTFEKEVGDCDHFKHLELNHILCKKNPLSSVFDTLRSQNLSLYKQWFLMIFHL